MGPTRQAHLSLYLIFSFMTDFERGKAIDEIPELFSKLQSIVARLEELFPERHFTLDGHLVGSIAEVIASYMYDLELLPASQECHDGRCRRTGINVQVKGTQRNRVAMYAEPEHLIVLKFINSRVEEIYNGPGKLAWDAAGAVAKNGQKSISVKKLCGLAQDVPAEKRLPPRHAMMNRQVQVQYEVENTGDDTNR
jgi:hypothetical protein